MATTTLTLSAERWLDQLMLAAQVLDAGAAPLVESFVLPAGLGDVAILSIMASTIVVGTVPVTATAPRGLRAFITAQDNTTTVDIVGTSGWYATGGSGAAFDRFDLSIDPDALTLFRQGENLVVNGPEMDAGVTGDFLIKVKAVRVRPIEAPARGPVRLVR